MLHTLIKISYTGGYVLGLYIAGCVMASEGFMPKECHLHGVQPQGKFLTFVVPAPNGCNLICAFCLIRQRQEIRVYTLQPADYARFIRETAANGPIYAISIQGYEPLLPVSLPYTQAVLATGRMLDLPTGLVTNGTHLQGAIDLLQSARPDRVCVSLDAAANMAAQHDRIRGKSGAWAATVDSIVCAVAELSFATELAVTSMLIPSRRNLLDEMPELLARLGVRHWIISPLQKVGITKAGGPVGNHRHLYEDLLLLQDAADREGVDMEVDDELDCLGYVQAAARWPELNRLKVRSVPQGVELVRLLPSGECVVGHDILRRASPNTPRWNPTKETASGFLVRSAMVY